MIMPMKGFTARQLIKKGVAMSYSDKNRFYLMGISIVGLFVVLCSLSGCYTSAADQLNPFYEDTDQEYGTRDNSAILEDGGGQSEERARQAFEVVGSYRRTQDPEPYYPVINSGEVRLMWVPDHLNKAGDLVPAHWYYLKVLNDRWNVQDSFDIEQQLNQGSSGAGSATPFVYK